MAHILDQHGRPIQRKTLDEPQTARVSALRREFAEHPSRGLTPGKLARILEDAEQGDLIAQADLFDDMEEKDAHIHAEMQKRRLCLLGLDWDVVPPRNPTAAEERAAAMAREVLQDAIDLGGVILDMASAIGHGYACLEYTWQRQGSQWLPARMELRPQRWFTTDTDTRSELRLRDGTADGQPLRPFGWLVHRHQARSGYLGRAGLHRVLAWPYLFKNYSVRDLAEFLEIYGLPLRLGTYPTGANDAEKATLMRAVVDIGHAAAGIIPEGMMIEFKEAAKGASDPFMAMIEWCERSQSKAILGGTLTTSAENTGLGSNLGDVHNEIRRDILEADARQIAASITRDLVYPLVALNTAGISDMHRAPRFVFDLAEPEDLALYAEAIPKLVQTGARIPTRWLHERLRIPEPEDDEPVLTLPGAPASAPLAAAPHACPHCGTAALGAHGAEAGYPDQAAIDSMLDAIGNDDLQAQADALLGPVLALLSSSGPEAAMARLADVYPDMDDSALAEQLARVIFVAETWGRINGREN